MQEVTYTDIPANNSYRQAQESLLSALNKAPKGKAAVFTPKIGKTAKNLRSAITQTAARANISIHTRIVGNTLLVWKADESCKK